MRMKKSSFDLIYLILTDSVWVLLFSTICSKVSKCFQCQTWHTNTHTKTTTKWFISKTIRNLFNLFGGRKTNRFDLVFVFVAAIVSVRFCVVHYIHIIRSAVNWSTPHIQRRWCRALLKLRMHYKYLRDLSNNSFIFILIFRLFQIWMSACVMATQRVWEWFF